MKALVIAGIAATALIMIMGAMHMHKTPLQAPLYNEATVEYHMTLKNIAHEVNKK